jgi:hypothetical protein
MSFLGRLVSTLRAAGFFATVLFAGFAFKGAGLVLTAGFFVTFAADLSVLARVVAVLIAFLADGFAATARFA